MTSADLSSDERSHLYYWRLGMLGIFSMPALILTTSFLGFAALARDAGVNWIEASFMTFTVWALPANIILVGAISAGVSLPAAALAVGLSSLRLMPMIVALMAEVRTPRTSTWRLAALSHFVAVTGWVFAMERMGDIPRDKRVAFVAGFTVTLTIINTIVVALVFNLMGAFSALVTGALAFLTPLYFLCSLYGSARDAPSRLALFTGMVCVPPAHWLAPEFDILIAGIGGGLLAFILGSPTMRARLAAKAGL